ncbi:hypothetical protein [Pseudomonas brassicacearum]|uniref:hypothetical protein n=1 Tax=Pseudomonas brassicacearum TaxID=930166 RepID=UPI00161AE825|nr:hypothetical protein [Pseudomonas brassicacearum]
MPSLSEAPNGGAKAFGYFGLFKVTRCKSGTASRRYRENGYAPQPKKQKAKSKKQKAKSKKKGRHNPTLQRPEGDR